MFQRQSFRSRSATLGCQPVWLGVVLVLALCGVTGQANAQAMGACCLPPPDSSCVVITEAACDAMNGSYAGDGTICDGECGACCIGSDCMELPELVCIIDEGGTFSGAGSVCFETNPDLGIECTGACCYFDDNTELFVCAELAEADCALLTASEYKGSGIDCDQVICRIEGACCLGDGTCVSDTSLAECNGLGGEWMDFGSRCPGDPAPAYEDDWSFELPPDVSLGACCFVSPRGITTCEQQTRDDCEAVGGQYYGAGSLCADVDCNTIVECVPFSIQMNGGDNVFFLPKFDDMGGLLRLDEVAVKLEGRTVLVAIHTNLGNLPRTLDVDLTENVFWCLRDGVNTNVLNDPKFDALPNLSLLAGFPSNQTPAWLAPIPPNFLGLGTAAGQHFFDFDLNTVCDGFPPCGNLLGPGDSCAYFSPYIFPGSVVNEPNNGCSDDSDPATTQTFMTELVSVVRAIHGNAIDDLVAMTGNMQFQIVLQAVGDTDLADTTGKFNMNVDPHRAVGTICVCYTFTEVAACCYCDDADMTVCENLSEDECDVLDGTWNEGVLCQDDDTNPDGFVCPILGACCLCDGTCIPDVTEVDCEAEPLFYEWTECADCFDPDTAPDGIICLMVGACCLCDGTCIPDITEDACLALDPDATWELCASCDDLDCEVGACCIPVAPYCIVVTEDCCEDVYSGTYQGDGTDCLITGACCLDDGACIETTEDCCEALGGAYQGDDTECAPVGACCLPDGSCVEIAELCCIELGGDFQGEVTVCGEIVACCLPDDSCVEIYAICCLDAGGEFVPDATCDPGACCLPDGSCVDTSEVCCLLQGGNFYAGESCTPVGGCCLPDGSCLEISEICCLDQGGEFVEDATCDLGACCLPDGMCLDTNEVCCIVAGGSFYVGAVCGDAGACCLPDGSCIETTEVCCINEFDGTFLGAGEACEPEIGACCLPDNTCIDNVSKTCCESDIYNGVFLGDGTDCGNDPTPGACCLPDGTCVENVSEACCESDLLFGGDFQGPGSVCGDLGLCCLPGGGCLEDQWETCCENLNGIFLGPGVCGDLGACCLTGGGCIDTTEECCLEFGGDFVAGETCAEYDCPVCVRNEKGSLLVFPKIEIRWDSEGNLIQDTFLMFSNDWPEDVYVKLFFVNGDPPLPADPATGERAHPGWNFVNNSWEVTGNQPTYWSANTGRPAAGGLSPFANVLDPPLDDDDLPGRPDPERPGERMMRGFLVMWAVNNNKEQIRWNHLSGKATLVNYALSYAWEYPAAAYGVCAADNGGVAHGEVVGEPGVINLDGLEYAFGYNQLLMHFAPPPALSFSAVDGGQLVVTQTDLTLMPMHMDFTNDSTGPVTTTAKFDVWNMNESKFSNTKRCITCWDQLLLANYDNPNDFVIGMLQTAAAKARIDGIPSAQCNGDVNGLSGVISQAAVLEGVVAKFMMMADGSHAAAGMQLFGMGEQEGQILYTPLNQPILEIGGDDDDPDQDPRRPNRPIKEPPTDPTSLNRLLDDATWGMPPARKEAMNLTP